jgi:hypothetical protein
MYKNQKGLFPFICNIIGLMLFVFPTFIILVENIYELADNFTITNLILQLIISLVLLSFPLTISFFLLKMFPRIKISQHGIHYWSFLFGLNTITWDDIEGIIRYKNGYGAIIFQKRGFYFFNGTYFNMLYGMIFRIHRPILLLSPNILTRTNLIEILREKNISGSGNKIW